MTPPITQYALFLYDVATFAVRLEETIDMSTTIKFVYIRWCGVNVPFTMRGKYGVVQGSVEKLFTVSGISK